VLPEDDGSRAIQENTPLRRPPHRAGEHLCFDVPPDANEIQFGGAVIDPFDRLLDDRPFVQVARDEMGGGADQLDAPVMRAPIRTGSLEARQETVMNVDATPREPI